MSEIDWARVEQHLRAKANHVGAENIIDEVVHRPIDKTAGRILFALAEAIHYGLLPETDE